MPKSKQKKLRIRTRRRTRNKRTRLGNNCESRRVGPIRLRIKHREFMATIDSAYTEKNYSLNPGLVSTFPWLSGIASNFEKYQFHSLKFQFITAASTTASGSLFMAVDYDALDANSYNSVEDLMSFEDATSTQVWKSATMICSKHNLRGKDTMFVRKYDVSGDLKMYDIGKLYVNNDAGVVAGQLWVDYDITFETPQRSDELDGALYEEDDVEGVGNYPSYVTQVYKSLPVTKKDDYRMYIDRPGKYVFENMWTYMTQALNGSNAPTLVTPGASIGTMSYDKFGGVGDSEYATHAEVDITEVDPDNRPYYENLGPSTAAAGFANVVSRIYEVEKLAQFVLLNKKDLKLKLEKKMNDLSKEMKVTELKLFDLQKRKILENRSQIMKE